MGNKQGAQEEGYKEEVSKIKKLTCLHCIIKA